MESNDMGNRSVKNVFFRIDRYAIQMNFVMHMGTSASAGIPHRGNLVPTFNRFPALDSYFIQMPETGQHAVSMIDINSIAEQSLTAGKGNDAVGGGDNGRSFTIGNVKPLVKLAPAGKRGYSITEVGCFPPLTGPDGRRGGQQALLILEVFEKRVESLVLIGRSQMELIYMLVHLSKQAVVLPGQRNLSVEVFRNRPSNTKEVVLVANVFNICDNPDFFLEIVQIDQFIFKIGNLTGKLLNLLPLTNNFVFLTGELNRIAIRSYGGYFQIVVIIGQNSDSYQAENDETL